MVSITRPITIFEANPGGDLLVATGNVLGLEQPDVVVAGDSKLHIFSNSNNGYYLNQTIDVTQTILSLEVGRPVLDTNIEIIVVGTEDRLLAYGNRGGAIRLLWETVPETGAQFNAIVLADLDGDGRQELAASALTNQTVFVYVLTGQTPENAGIQLLAIRQLPGQPMALTAFRPNGTDNNYLAIAYKNESNGIQTLFLTDRGFAEGPFITNLPYQIVDLTAANLLPNLGEELAGAGSDGSVKIYRGNTQLSLQLITSNLGSTVTSVDAKNFNEARALLVAGTPGSYVFGFYSPNLSSEPNLAFRAPGPINDLAVIEPNRLALGTSNGIFQIWQWV